MISSPIQNLIDLLSRLPGMGQRSAARLAMWLLNQPQEDLQKLTEAIETLKQQTKICQRCFNWISNDNDICTICNDQKRDHSTICVVEDVLDMIPMERTKYYQGVYHILGGLISPPDGIGPEKLHIKELIGRINPVRNNISNGVKNPQIKEIILALNPTAEGDTTVFYLEKILKPFNIKITRLGRGLSTGSDLEYTDEATLSSALKNRG